MASRNRNRMLEAKLVIENSKPAKTPTTDIITEQILCSQAFKGSKHVSIVQIDPSTLISQNPAQHPILTALLAKHILRSKNAEIRRLQTRPKTVSNLKNSKKKKRFYMGCNEAGDKAKEVDILESLPKLSANLSKIKTEMIGDYELGVEIGKGAYGVVRLGYHQHTHEKVAVKMYEKCNLMNPNRMKSVEREIKILNKLKHPNIIELKATIDTPTSVNLIFEYISGCSLLDYLKNRSSRRIEEYQARTFFKQLMHALDFCHSLGVTHRDIKLENILLDQKQNLKLIDFGFSTWIASERKVQLFCGTSSYMAPEIVSGKEYCGPPTDIWAAGVLLFVMITGTFPFKASSNKELYSKIQRGSYVMPPTLTNEVKELIKKIFEHDPCRRPTAKEIIENKWVNCNDDKWN